jgi:hypothetical protein
MLVLCKDRSPPRQRILRPYFINEENTVVRREPHGETPIPPDDQYLNPWCHRRSRLDQALLHRSPVIPGHLFRFVDPPSRWMVKLAIRSFVVAGTSESTGYA